MMHKTLNMFFKGLKKKSPLMFEYNCLQYYIHVSVWSIGILTFQLSFVYYDSFCISKYIISMKCVIMHSQLFYSLKPLVTYR
jgi:hypothetical protein